MLQMLLDTSSTILYIAFVKDNKVIYENINEGKNNHSDNLLRLIQKGLKENNLEVKDFDRIVLGKGPGMYTGLRVSMTVAKMFAWTLNIPLYTISSIDLLISGYYKKDGIYAVMLKAKKDHSYTKVVKMEKGKMIVLRKEEFMNNEEFLNKLKVDGIKYDYLIDNSNVKINTLEICNEKENGEEQELVTNIHALEPNYLRADI